MNHIKNKKNYSIIFHGGYSQYTKDDLDLINKEAGDSFPQLRNLECIIHQYIYEYLEKAENMLSNGYSAEDVCVTILMMMEDNGIFNAGRGGQRNKNGKFTMDASLMDGNRYFGSTNCITKIKNPIKMCQYLKKKYNKKILGGNDAEKWADINGLDILMEPEEYFHSPLNNKINEILNKHNKLPSGPIGCIVKDIYGNFCTGTSNISKPNTHINDASIIGIGTFCSNIMGAINCSGTGDTFFSDCIAFDTLTSFNNRKDDNEKLSDYMRYSLDKLANQSSGIIGMDKDGKCFSYFTSDSMAYGYIENGSLKGIDMWKPKLK